MAAIKKLAENTGAMMIARGLQPLLNFLLVLVISRAIGVEGLGEYTTVFALLVIFQLICNFGMRMLLTREVVKYPDQTNKYLVNSIFIVAIISVISSVAMLVTIFILNYTSHVALAASVLSAVLIAEGLIECFVGVLAGYERLKVVAIIAIIEEVIKVAVSVTLLLSGYGVLMIVIIYIILRYVALLLLFFFTTRSIAKLEVKIDFQFCRGLLKETRYFAISAIVFSIYLQLDVVLLSKFGSIADVGIYGAALRIFRFILIVVHSFFIAFYPILSRLYKEDLLKFQKACYSTGKYFMMALIPMAVMVTFFLDRIVIILFGQDFEPSIPVLQIIIWSIIPFATASIFSYALLASNNQKLDLLANICSTIIKFVLIMLMALKFGYIGVAIGMVITTFVWFGAQFFAARKLVPLEIKIIFDPLLKILSSGLAMLIIILLLKPYSIIIALFSSSVVYIGGLYLLKVFSDRDRIFIQELIKKKTVEILPTNP